MLAFVVVVDEWEFHVPVLYTVFSTDSGITDAEEMRTLTGPGNQEPKLVWPLWAAPPMDGRSFLDPFLGVSTGSVAEITKAAVINGKLHIV